MNKLLAIFHDNDLYSGATLSFLSNIEYIQNNGIAEVMCLLPQKKGELKEYLNRNGFIVCSSHYGSCVYSEKDNWFKGLVRCFTKYLIMQMSINISLLEKIRQYDPDIIYTNSSTNYMGAFLNRKLKKKHIWHFREFGELDQGTKRLFGFDFLQNNINRYTDKVIMISKTLDDYYSSKIDFHIEHEVIYNDIDPKYILPFEKKALSNDLYIVGTISENKGQKLVIDAVELLGTRSIEVSLHIVGSRNSYSRQLEKHCKKEKINSVEFCGLVKDMVSFRSNGGISIVASSSEAFGRVVIESMLAGSIVLASDSGALPEFVKNMDTGILFKKGVASDLADKIEFVLKHPKEVDKIRLNAYRTALEFCERNCAQSISHDIMEMAQRKE